MAIKEHVQIFRNGADVWNRWRVENPRTAPDLSFTEFVGEDFSGVNLTNGNFKGANFSQSIFKSANLSGANFESAILVQARLDSTNCRSARFLYADLSEASLANAYLVEADFSGAFLGNVDISFASLWQTGFGGTVLTGAKGLETCIHCGPSTIDHRTIQTLLASGSFNTTFLKGCGLPEDLIEHLPSVLKTPREFYSCFISYSHTDRKFARKLYDSLTSNGVRCWFDEHRMIGGESMYKQITEGIRRWDKVLLCCSKESLAKSLWVKRETEAALQKEEDLWSRSGEKRSTIIPLNLDGYLFEWGEGNAPYIKPRFAIDFTSWETDRGLYHVALEKLLRSLHIASADNEKTPDDS